MTLHDRFYQEVTSFIDDKELNIGMVEKLALKNYTGSFYTMIEQKPDAALIVLQKLRDTLNRIIENGTKG